MKKVLELCEQIQNDEVSMTEYQLASTIKQLLSEDNLPRSTAIGSAYKKEEEKPQSMFWKRDDGSCGLLSHQAKCSHKGGCGSCPIYEAWKQKETRQATQKEPLEDEECIWKKSDDLNRDMYDQGCGGRWILNTGIEYCPRCGKKVRVQEKSCDTCKHNCSQEKEWCIEYNYRMWEPIEPEKELEKALKLAEIELEKGE